MESCSRRPFQRLPRLVTPVNYEIQLTPDLSKLTFEGRESIQLNVNEKTDTIVLNANKLSIHNDTVDQSNVKLDNKVIKIKEVKYNQEEETVTILLEEPLVAGQAAQLNLSFNGVLGDKLRGFYASRYIGPDGQQRVTAVTQFEATDARLAFPCWDEPAHKATFDISLVIPDDGKTLALSNMPVKEDTKLESQKQRLVRFDRTPIMSTYLVAFVVGEFDYIEQRSKHGVLVRVYTPIGKSEQGSFALDVAARSLDFFTDYFQIPYPLTKLDLIAVSDFAAGAMENWGLVTYREMCLLVDPKNTATIRTQNVSLTVAHELAHQWFGNLVTMEWWTDLWLNEGFATFMQYLCVDSLFPKFNIWAQFVSDVFLVAMDLDSLENSHPIEIPVGHPSEVEQIFDDISYSKGACVIRMLYNYIGGEMFRKGMKLYLSRHSYKNTHTQDLWQALEEASQKPIGRMMTTWTKQQGYPMITIQNDGQKLLLNQEKFNANGKRCENGTLWANPIQMITASSGEKPIFETLFEKKSDSFELPGLNLDNEWLKLNPQAVATLRVKYNEQLFERLLVGIANQTLLPVDRLNLVDDLYAMTMAGQNSSDNLLKAIESFCNECDYTVWTVMSLILGKYNQLLYGCEYYDKFVQFGIGLIMHKAYEHIGPDPKTNEPHLNTLLRSLLINRLVMFEHPDTMKRFQKAFDDHVEKRQLIPADLRSSVYQAMAKQCDETIWEKFMKLYKEAELQEEKNRISSSLGAVKKPEYIDRVLQFAISDQVRSQDTVFVVSSVARNPLARRKAWDFFVANKDLFKSRYENGFLGNHLIKCLLENFQTDQMVQEIKDYFQKNCFLGWERSIQQLLETIKLNAELLKRDSEKLAKFFEKAN